MSTPTVCPRPTSGYRRTANDGYSRTARTPPEDSFSRCPYDRPHPDQPGRTVAKPVADRVASPVDVEKPGTAGDQGVRAVDAAGCAARPAWELYNNLARSGSEPLGCPPYRVQGVCVVD